MKGVGTFWGIFGPVNFPKIENWNYFIFYCLSQPYNPIFQENNKFGSDNWKYL